MALICRATSIPEVKLLVPDVWRDARGFFQELYHEQKYRECGISARFVQDNWSHSSRGVLRGMHFQLQKSQAKLVSVLRGTIYDVAVDVRRGSPTFGKWVGAELSDENHHQFFIPEGFAHGFCVLSDEVDFHYKCSDFYDPRDEVGFRWSDPAIGIDWPFQDVILSSRDQTLPSLESVPADRLPRYS